MSRVFKYIVFTFFIAKAIGFSCFALAQDETIEKLIARPEVEYKSGQLRDPFQTYIIKEMKVQEQVQDVSSLPQPGINLNQLNVQGIIWGGKMPQAIINDKIYIVGDLIEGAEILSIDKEGIKLSSAAGILELAAPGKASPAGQMSEAEQNSGLSTYNNNNVPGMPMPAYANNPVFDNKGGAK